MGKGKPKKAKPRPSPIVAREKKKQRKKAVRVARRLPEISELIEEAQQRAVEEEERAKEAKEDMRQLVRDELSKKKKCPCAGCPWLLRRPAPFEDLCCDGGCAKCPECLAAAQTYESQIKDIEEDLAMARSQVRDFRAATEATNSTDDPDRRRLQQYAEGIARCKKHIQCLKTRRRGLGPAPPHWSDCPHKAACSVCRARDAAAGNDVIVIE